MLATIRRFVFRPARFVLAALGAVGLVFALALAAPLHAPPFLPSIQTGARAIDQSKLQQLARFAARDGTELAYRAYPAAGGDGNRIAIVVHGSSANARAVTALAVALADAGVTAIAVDMRGHGASGQRGDIAFIGQLENDLEDLVATLKKDRPDARLALVGHSSGGGFALRIAGEKTGELFDRFVFVSPYLGYRAPTLRDQKGDAIWAVADLPRVFALLALNVVGIDALNGLPALAFATAPGSERYLTTRYSFRLMTNFGPPPDWRVALANISRPATLVVGADDELFDASKYAQALAGYEDKVALKIVPGVDHMGAVREKAALDTIVGAAAGGWK